jgi:arylsulfatase A-like enzyme
MKSKPNILFILSDDHAVKAISALNRTGQEFNHTPNIDRIASEGAVFENSFCCNSICTPSRASILTGKHSLQNGVLTLNDALADDQVTFAGLLKQAGYQTAIVGKWHLHNNPKPEDFDFWEVLPGQGKYYNPEYITPNGNITREGYVSDLTTDSILNWLENDRDKEKPFLACLQFKAPHRPWMPAPRFFDLFEGRNFPEPPHRYDDYSNRCEVLKKNKLSIDKDLTWNTDLKVHDPGPNTERLRLCADTHPEYEWDRMTPQQLNAWNEAYHERNEYVKNRELTDEEFSSFVYQSYLTDYLSCIAAIDDNVGRALQYLDDSGLAENTIVVYCSDQGFYLGEHGWYDKRWIFEESMRMPLIIRWPGKIQPGSNYSQLVQNIDYAPTLLEACGLKTPDDMHGTSLLRVIEDNTVIHEDLYYHYYQHGGHGVSAHDGIRNKRYKLIHFYTENEFNLIDLEKDPLEMVSRHDDPEYRDILEEMKERYWQSREKFEIPDEYGPNGKFAPMK